MTLQKFMMFFKILGYMSILGHVIQKSFVFARLYHKEIRTPAYHTCSASLPL